MRRFDKRKSLRLTLCPTYNDRDLAFGRPLLIMGQEIGRSPAAKLFEFLGQFPRDAKHPIGH
jgi:hypothetical protein